MKYISDNIFSNETFELIHKILSPRLMVLAELVKGKNNWKDCGNIHDKKAVKYDNNYIWGIRFYILLLECY